MSFRPLSLALLACLVGCDARNEYQQPPPPEVTVATPIAKTITLVEEFTGYCDASRRVDIRARVEGFLEAYYFNEGAEVKAGDLLAKIDPKPFQATLEQAEAALLLAKAEVVNAEAGVTQAQARAANADAQFRRGERTREGGGISEAELDDLRTERATAIADFRAAEAGVKSAEAQVEVAEAQVAQAQLDLGYTDVAAPVDGRVGQQQVDVGNLVGAGEPTLLTKIVQYDPVYVYFTVTEREFLQHIRERPDGPSPSEPGLDEQNIEVRVSLEGEQGFPHVGRLDFAALEIDANTGTYALRATFENADRLIPPGAFARVQVPGDAIDALLIPEAAIGRSPAGPFVIVVGGDNKCERREVELGLLTEDGRAVTDGLGAEDRIVVNGLQQARPGVEVRPVEAAGKTTARDTADGTAENTIETAAGETPKT
ncbi:MAG: efflux RND transporter periplasmic adaptor subunit [Planctomycetota bacterium]